MSIPKPTIPKGTRDFGPLQMARRNYIFDTIKETFRLFGYQQLETPAMENLSTLTGKYGDEGDKLLYRVLDSGEFYEKAREKILAPKASVYSLLKDFYGSFLEAPTFDTSDEILEELKSISSKVSDIENFFLQSRHSTRLSKREMDPIIDYHKKNKDYISGVLFRELFDLRYFRQNAETEVPHQLEISKSNLDSEILDRAVQYLVEALEGEALMNESSKDLSSKIAEKGLRYDLTVPFARYVVMNRNEIVFPFKRFQIQPVWRADRPQRGRYREFYQCDADVVGTDSLICEAEILLMIRRVFSHLSLKDYTIKINNRKILTGISEVIGEPGKEGELCVAIDKLDKIGWEKVQEELLQRGFTSLAIKKLSPIVLLNVGNVEKISFLETFLKESPIGLQGLKELKEVFEMLSAFGEGEEHVDFDVVLARGLSYYTGAIFEVKANGVSIGSVAGGGRYDNLTGVFGLADVPGVGFSFGVDRIYDVLEELKLFPDEQITATKVMVGFLDLEGKQYGLRALSALRAEGITAEIYPDEAKLKKQFNYADKKNISFVLMAGSEEIAQQKFTLKNMKTGEQQMITLKEAIDELQSN